MTTRKIELAVGLAVGFGAAVLAAGYLPAAKRQSTRLDGACSELATVSGGGSVDASKALIAYERFCRNRPMP